MGQYIPTLRSKEGELKALKNLKTESCNKLIPFLNITRPEFDRESKKDKKTLEKHLSDTADKISKNCESLPVIFVDFDFPDSSELCGGVHYAVYFFDKLAELGINFIPVTGLDRIDDSVFQESLKTVSKKHKTDIGIRVDREDLELMEMQHEGILAIAETFGKDKNNIHLLFDLKSITSDDVAPTSKLILEAVGHIEDFETYSTVTIISGGMPLTMAEFPTNAVSKHPRADWDLWETCTKKIDRDINFGDYGIISPEPSDVDPRIMTRASRIRYTEPTHWRIFKGHSLKATKEAIQNPKLANLVVSDKVYRGEKYSFGDAYIKKCADREVVGNATNWVTADMNHHFEEVINQLSK